MAVFKINAACFQRYNFMKYHLSKQVISMPENVPRESKATIYKV